MIIPAKPFTCKSTKPPPGKHLFMCRNIIKHIYTHIHIIHTHIYTHTHTYIYIHTYTYIHIYIYTPTQLKKNKDTVTTDLPPIISIGTFDTR